MWCNTGCRTGQPLWWSSHSASRSSGLRIGWFSLPGTSEPSIYIFAETIQGSVPRWDDDQERRDGIGPAEGRNKCSRGKAFQGCWRDETCDDRGNNCNTVWTEQSIVFIDKVAMAWSSMNHGDVFVLDSGKKIFVWKGSGASGQEKMTAGQIAAR